VPLNRSAHVAVLRGNDMIVYGGDNGNWVFEPLQDLEKFSLGTIPLSLLKLPAERLVEQALTVGRASPRRLPRLLIPRMIRKALSSGRASYSAMRACMIRRRIACTYLAGIRE
jgi:hypothetical protein